MCAIHGQCPQIPVSPDLLKDDSDRHQGGRGVYEYLVGVPHDPWASCFMTETFAAKHGLDLRKGWEEEDAKAPSWYAHVSSMCTKCFADRYPFYWTLRHPPLVE
jgi:hypothetical protein